MASIREDRAAPPMVTLCDRKGLKILGWGAGGMVFKVNDETALKINLRGEDSRMKLEDEFFEILEQHPLCPDIVRSILRLPDMNFLQLLPGGTLEARIRAEQTRDPTTRQVIDVKRTEPIDLIRRWMVELSSAAEWLESLGFAHSDLRPVNLLLDSALHLKLIDFDNVARIGDEFEAGIPPYARVLLNGRFGYLGARTEQFSFGSVYYFVSRGYQPYDNEWYGENGRKHGPETVDKLQKMDFPALTESKDDLIIRQCWYGEFLSMKELSNALSGFYTGRRTSLSVKMVQDMQKTCSKFLSEDLGIDM